MSLRLLIMLLALAPCLRAAGADEKLAGEDDKAVPTAVPTPMGDERGPLHASRTARVASSFDLPAFVVTGTGERQSLARRQDLGAGLDTSGGIKTSPGEQGAGKDQLEAQAERESLENVSGTSRPLAGGLRLAGGYQPGFDAAGYLAQEQGPWFWALDGAADYSEGGLRRGPMRDPALGDQGGLNARAGWRFEGGWVVSAFGQGAFATRAPQPYVPGQTGALRRGLAGGGLELDGRWGGLSLRGRAQGGQLKAQVPGAELSEDQAGADLELSRRFSGRTGSALLEAALAVDASSQAVAGRRRSRSLLRGSLLSRFEAFKGNRLGLGLALDAVSGDDQVLQLGPLLRLDQRLAGGLSLQASLDSGLRLSRLKREDGIGPPWHAPDPSLKPARLSLDSRATLHWKPVAGLQASLGAFFQQGEDWFLPQSSQGSVLAVDGAVRGWRLQGLTLDQRWRRGAWWQSAGARLQRVDLPDIAAWPTFVPGWSAELAAGYARGPVKLQAKLELQGARHAAPDGSLPMVPSAALSALAGYDLNEAWTVLAEGRNLAAQRVEVVPYYPEAAPYVGLGLEFRF